MLTKVNATNSMTARRQILLQLTMRRDSLPPENSRDRKMFRYSLNWLSRARRQQQCLNRSSRDVGYDWWRCGD